MKKSTDTALIITADYRQFIEELKARVTTARVSAARRINHELILLYWDIGRGIVEKQQALGWGESVVEMVAADLRQAFPSMNGFSPRNVWYMRRLHEAYSAPEFVAQVAREMSKRGSNPILPQPVAELVGDEKRRQLVAKLEAGGDPTVILQQPVAELKTSRIWPQPVAKMGARDDPDQCLQQLVADIPWGQHITIIEKLSDPAARLWYLGATARFGWSRNILPHRGCIYQPRVAVFPLPWEPDRQPINPNGVVSTGSAHAAIVVIRSSSFGVFHKESGAIPAGYDRQSGTASPKTDLSGRIPRVPAQARRRMGRADCVGLTAPARWDSWRSASPSRDTTPMGLGFFDEHSQGRPSFLRPTLGFGTESRWDSDHPIGVAAYELKSKLPGELKGKLPSAKQLAAVLRVEMEAGK
jgi:predicted nuclease of restriction endonuclease-like (RecB) superfamily